MAQRADDLNFLEYWDEMFNNGTHELKVYCEYEGQILMVESGGVMNAVFLTAIPSNLQFRSLRAPSDAPRDKDDDASKLKGYEKKDPKIPTVTVIGRCGDKTVVRFDSRWTGYQVKKEIRESFVLEGGRLEDVNTGVVVGDDHVLEASQLRFVGGIPLSGDYLSNKTNVVAASI